MPKLYINGCHEAYKPAQLVRTMTVRELIAALEEYDEDMPVFLRFDDGYTFGSIKEDYIYSSEELDYEEE